MKKTKIYLNKKKTKYCVVQLFSTKKEMQAEYKKRSPNDKYHEHTLGVHLAYKAYKVPDKLKKKYKNHKGPLTEKQMKDWKLAPETGTILLSKPHSGAGVVTHEIMHAVLWSRGHGKGKVQYPITIKNIKEEESLLHDFTHAVMQFYRWYWRVEKNI